MAFFNSPGHLFKLQHPLAFKAHLIPLSSANHDFSLFQLLKLFLCLHLCIILLVSTPNPFSMLRTQYKGYSSEFYNTTTLTHEHVKEHCKMVG